MTIPGNLGIVAETSSEMARSKSKVCCTVPCWSSCLSFLTLLLILIAIVSPWYLTMLKADYQTGKGEMVENWGVTTCMTFCWPLCHNLPAIYLFTYIIEQFSKETQTITTYYWFPGAYAVTSTSSDHTSSSDHTTYSWNDLGSRQPEVVHYIYYSFFL